MSEMVNRVARVLAWREFSAGFKSYESCQDAGMQERFDAWLAPQFKPFEGDARAAIEAMREPTPAMIEAGEDAPIVNYDGNDPRQVWQLMLDEALNP